MLSRFLNRLLSLIYPERCLSCGKLITKPYFCKKCFDDIKEINLKICFKCGLPVKLCTCKRNFYYFKYVISPFENNGNVKSAFYRCKFGGAKSGYKFFAQKMAEWTRVKYSKVDFDLVCWVPCHTSSKNKYGYDRVGYLAKLVANNLKLPAVDVLKQPKPSASQHDSSGINERFNNVQGKYKTKYPGKVRGKTVLLVDDIKTSGATLSETARELKLSGAKEVYALTALTTYPEKKPKLKPIDFYLS